MLQRSWNVSKQKCWNVEQYTFVAFASSLCLQRIYVFPGKQWSVFGQIPRRNCRCGRWRISVHCRPLVLSRNEHETLSPPSSRSLYSSVPLCSPLPPPINHRLANNGLWVFGTTADVGQDKGMLDYIADQSRHRIIKPMINSYWDKRNCPPSFLRRLCFYP